MTDRTAIVTGAGKRVGAVIAQALLDDGWSVLAVLSLVLLVVYLVGQTRAC